MIPTRRAVFVVIATAALLLMVAVHAPWMNGPWYWKWSWKDDVPLTTAAIALLLASAPLATALVLWRRRSAGVLAVLLLMMCSSFALQLSVAGLQDPQFRVSRRIATVVLDPRVTGYLQTAAQLESTGGNWLAGYPALSVTSAVAAHAKSKPPGLVVYYALVRRVVPASGDPTAAAVVGGVLAGLLAALAIPAVYFLIWYFGRDPEAAILGSAVMALAPAMVVWLPEFDPVYPALSCLWIGLWAMAVDRGRILEAIAVGVVIAVSVFLAYNMLVLGALLAGYAVVAVQRGRATLQRVAVQAGAVLGTIVALYVAMRVTTGFDAMATFLQALGNQSAMLELTSSALPRPYPQTILFDLTDFAMAGAWITLLPGAWWTLDRVRERNWSDPFPVVALGIGQLLLVAVTGLLAAETFRVWIFMLPLVVLPAALELRRWPWRSATLFLVCLWMLTVAIAQNMDFA